MARLRKNNNSASYLKLLGVEKQEAPLVFPLLLHNFFLGAGIAFLFTTSSAIFLHEFEGEYLALAFVVAGALMLVAARIYAHFEHRLKLQKYLPAVVLTLPILVLAVRLSGYAVNHALAAFAMLVAYRIVYMLANLEFWGLTSLVFNIRQSKRLFGLIGSGDIPAKILGYLAVSLLSKTVEPENLLYVSVVAFLIAFFMLQRVLKNPAATAMLDKHSHHHAHAADHSPDKFVQRVFGNQFIWALAIFGFFSSLAMGLVDFAFYGKVKHRYHDSQELAAYLGTLMFIAMGTTFVLKLLLSGKIIEKIGVSRVLLTLPIALILPSIVMLLPLEMSSGEKNLLWFFTVMYVLRDVLKYSLLDPMFLALFQPLQSHLRLKGHTVVKGLVDPLGLLLIGGLLFLGEHFAEESMYSWIAIALVVICAFWIWSIRKVLKESLELLRSSLRKRFLEGQSVPIFGKAAADLLLAKLESTNVTEAIYALRMLEDNPQVDYEAVLLSSLNKDLPELQLFALERLETRLADIPEDILERIANEASQPRLQTMASRLLMRAEKAHLKYEGYASHVHEAIKKGAIAGLLQSDDTDARTLGRTHLQNHLDSAHPDDHMIGLWLIGETGMQEAYSTVERLMQVDAAHVVHGAIQAAGKLAHVSNLAQLLKMLKNPYHRSRTIEALVLYDAEQVLAAGNGDPDVLRILCRLAARSGSAIQTSFLTQQLSSQDPHVRREATYALMKRGFKATGDRKVKAHIAHLQQQLAASMQQYEHFLADDEGAAIASALEIELHGLVDQLLICLSFQYDSATVMRARHGLQFKSQEKRAGALETLDQLLSRTDASKLLHLLEVLYLDRAKNQIQKSRQKTMLLACEHLLQESSAVHDAWTICLATDYYLKNKTHPSQNLLAAAMVTPTPFLSQYGHWLQSAHSITLKNLPMHAHTETENSFSPLEMVLMLKASPIFSGTPENTLAEVAAIAHEERVPEGGILFKKGDPGDCMYIIAEGSIKIGDGATVFATMGKSDFFGELALVETEPRSADAVAATDCLLIRIDQDDFYELIEDRTEVARGILVILAQRLRRQNEIIRNLKEAQ